MGKNPINCPFQFTKHKPQLLEQQLLREKRDSQNKNRYSRIRFTKASPFYKRFLYIAADPLTFPPGRPSSSSACITIFSVLPEANVRVILRTGILLLGFTIKHNFNQLQSINGCLALNYKCSNSVLGRISGFHRETLIVDATN